MTKNLMLFACMLLLWRCEYIDSINKEGAIVTQEIDLLPFETITVEAPYQIVLVQSTESFIHLEGLDYLMKDVDIEQNGSNIYLKHYSPGNIQKDKMIKLEINNPNIMSITANAAGQLFTNDTLHISDLTIVVNGSGTYFDTNITISAENFSLNVYGSNNTGIHKISGKTTNAFFWMEGCTYALAENLISETVTFNHRSAGDCNINALSNINATIFSGGNIYYLGNPSIIFNRGETAFLKSTGQLLPYITK